MIPTLASSLALAGDSLPERLAARATQPDVVLVPPVGEPSPKLGSFVVAYAPPDGQAPDPARTGTYEVAPSSCSDALVFRAVAAVETREELWMVETGIGARVGLPALNVGGSWGTRSVAGISYQLVDKLVLDGGLDALEECCVRNPESCSDRYVAEAWRGTGAIHRVTSDSKALKTTLQQLDQLGRVAFGSTKGWTMASTWDEPMYFAYRVQTFQIPSCESYMNNLPEVDGQVRFTGVSRRLASEQAAREDARNDARVQVVRYLGEELHVSGDQVTSSAEAVLSGVKDTLTCLDPVTETPDGPAYLARVRMYVPRAQLEGAAAPMRTATGSPSTQGDRSP